MSRAARPDWPGARHHGVNRSAERAAIFHYGCLAAVVRGWRLRRYALLTMLPAVLVTGQMACTPHSISVSDGGLDARDAAPSDSLADDTFLSDGALPQDVESHDQDPGLPDATARRDRQLQSDAVSVADVISFQDTGLARDAAEIGDASWGDSAFQDAGTSLDVGPRDAVVSVAPCTPTATLHCKGSVSLLGVTLRDNRLEVGHMDVWRFNYNESRVGVFQVHHGNPKDGIISLYPDENLDDPLDPRCTHRPWYTESSFAFNEFSLADQWSCPLINGQTYYLKFKIVEGMPYDANYYLITNSQAQ